MYNLGISCYYHDSAASLLKDGHVIAAVEEERFSRKKFDDDFPHKSIQWCLEEAGITPDQIDSVAFYDKPSLWVNYDSNFDTTGYSDIYDSFLHNRTTAIIYKY